MSEYSSLKVPELKKLLAEKSLPQTGNKADLIARLQENDKAGEPEKPAETQQDEITYDEDEAVKTAAAAADPAPAPAPATTEPAKEESTTAPSEPAPTAAEPAAPAFTLGLASSTADQEAKKRADRAKRFGLEEDEEAKRKAERAQRFGADEGTVVKGLDSALPERPLKRGRGGADGGRPGKKMDRRGGGGGGGGGGRDRKGKGGGGGGAGGAGQKKGGIQDDPAEKAKAAARAARFATG